MAMNPTVLRQQFLQRPMFVAMDLMARWKCTCDGFLREMAVTPAGQVVLCNGIYKHIRFNDSTTDHVMDCVDPQQSGLYRVMDSTTDSMLDVMDQTEPKTMGKKFSWGPTPKIRLVRVLGNDLHVELLESPVR